MGNLWLKVFLKNNIVEGSLGAPQLKAHILYGE